MELKHLDIYKQKKNELTHLILDPSEILTQNGLQTSMKKHKSKTPKKTTQEKTI